jgi:hypothetical protein
VGILFRFTRSRADDRIRGEVAGIATRFTMSLPARLQVASSEYQRLQVDLSNAVEARQRLDAQLSENELVNKVQNFLLCPQSSSLTDDHDHCRSLPR